MDCSSRNFLVMRGVVSVAIGSLSPSLSSAIVASKSTTFRARLSRKLLDAFVVFFVLLIADISGTVLQANNHYVSDERHQSTYFSETQSKVPKIDRKATAKRTATKKRKLILS